MQWRKGFCNPRTFEKRRGSSFALISLVINTGLEGETKQVKSLQTDEEIGEGRKMV